jgi:membrane fusion protein (multidrug efflux system)
VSHVVTTCALAGLLATAGCQRAEDAAPAALPTVKVHLVAGDGGGAGESWVAATLNATQRATLSTRMGSFVKKVNVREGSRVAQGELLVSLSDNELQSALKAGETSLAAAAAYHRRIEALQKQGAATPTELEAAQAQLAQAQASLAGVRANIAYTQIRAPFSGVVQAKRVSEGDFVGPGTPLVDLEGEGSLELQAMVSDAESKDIKPGQTLPFESAGHTGTAEITALAPGGDPISHRRSLRARVVTGGEPLRSGAFARLRLPLATRQDTGLAVPRSALVQRGELNGVFIVKDGKAQLRWLAVGEAEGDRLPVKAGMTKGESVVDNPGDLKDGQPVDVAP